jgi:methylthioribose-1-phosphate isomerase
MPEPTRREFFRHFAGDLITSAAQLSGAVNELRDRSASEAAALLRDGLPSPEVKVLPAPDAPARTLPASPPVAAPAEVSAPPAVTPDALGAGSSTHGGDVMAREVILAPTGFHTPFRLASDDALLLVDQRELPHRLVEVPITSATDAARAIRDRVVVGGPAEGQVAAIALALSARTARTARPHARRAILEGAANTLRASRPAAGAIRSATDRLMARYREIGERSSDGEASSAAVMDEALAIVAEATEDHGDMADLGVAILPTPTGRALEILIHGSTGALASGQYGTALGVVEAAHHAERRVHVWVSESRPHLDGARLAAWELTQAGVPHTVIADAAAGALLAAGRVDVVLVGASRIAANGDMASDVGTYPLAVLAARHVVPFVVVAPLATVDLGIESARGIQVEERPSSELTALAGVELAAPGTAVLNPATDVTPPELISAIVTEEGVLGPPFPDALASAVERRSERRSERQRARQVATTPTPTAGAVA